MSKLTGVIICHNGLVVRQIELRAVPNLRILGSQSDEQNQLFYLQTRAGHNVMFTLVCSRSSLVSYSAAVFVFHFLRTTGENV